MNTLMVANALRALADAITAPESPASSPPADVPALAAVSNAPTAEAPKKRGRPPKNTASTPSAATATTAETNDAPATPVVDEKVYTDSDLRTALTQASTRLGSKEKVVALLQKYAGADKPPIVASIAAADYGKVVADCASLS
jgi:hypothetical protein